MFSQSYSQPFSQPYFQPYSQPYSQPYNLNANYAGTELCYIIYLGDACLLRVNIVLQSIEIERLVDLTVASLAHRDDC